MSYTGRPSPPLPLPGLRCALATLRTGKGLKVLYTNHPPVSLNRKHLEPTEEDQQMGLKDSYS